jgi:hypothetical protein
MVALPEDPTSFEGLTRAGMVITPPNWAAYQRDNLTDEERQAWDARAQSLGGRIETRRMESKGLRPGKQFAESQVVSYYLVPEAAS